MKVDPSTHQHTYVHQNSIKNRVGPVETDLSEPASQNPPPVETGSEGSETPQLKGVIRNLLEGHYKGVADIRLRINFQDELAAIQQTEQSQLAVAKTSDLIDGVRSRVETFAADLEPELAEQVSQALSGFSSAAEESSGLPVGELSLRLENAFSDLAAKLRGMLLPVEETVPENPAELEPVDTGAVGTEEPAPTGVAEELMEQSPELTLDSDPVPDPAETFLADLTDYFQTELSQLKTEISQFSILPEPSPPHGKGVAYDKFLAIYQNLTSVNAPKDTASEFSPQQDIYSNLDTIA